MSVLLAVILFPVVSPTDDCFIVLIVPIFGGIVGWIVGQNEQVERRRTVVRHIFNWTLGIIIGAIAGWILGVASGGVMTIFLGNTIFGIFGASVGWHYGRRIRSEQIDYKDFSVSPFWIIVGIIEMTSVGLLMTGFKPCGWLDSSLQLTGCTHESKVYGYDFPKLAFTPNGNTLALVGGRDTVLYLNENNLQPLSIIKWDKRRIQSLAFSPDSSLFALGDFDGLIGIFRVADGELLHVLQAGEYASTVNSIAFSSDGALLASANGSAINLWDVKNQNLLRTIYQDGYDDANSLAFSPDGTVLASGSDSGAIRLWDIPDGTLINTFKKDAQGISCIAFSPNGDVLAAGGIDEKIRLWKISDGSLLHILEGHKDEIRSIAFSPDGLILASGSRDTTVRIWRVSDGSMLRILRHGFGRDTKEGISSVVFSPDGKLLVTGASEPPLASRVRQFQLR